MGAGLAMTAVKRSRVRLLIVTMLFIATTINYADRATLSIAGPSLAKDLGLDAVAMGYVFSAFAWSYVLAQLPGGWLLDRYGAKWVYAGAIFLWSAFTLMQGAVGFLTGFTAVAVLFGLRLLVGLAEAPVFPANARITAAWFPTAERGTASAFFNSSQYFATVLFTPLMGFVVHNYGWHQVFTLMGALGIAFALGWTQVIHGPKDHPSINQGERDYIEAGGALLDMDGRDAGVAQVDAGRTIRQLLANRMLLGIYVGQYCITTLTYFFLTWFPVYLVKERGLSILQAGFAAVLPALCGFVGGILGGWISDRLLKRGWSLTASRKIPIVGGDAALDGDRRLQLRPDRRARGRADGAGLLRQGRRGARLGGGLRHLAAPGRRPVGRAVQHLRQHRRHHHSDRDRLHRPADGLFQRGAGCSSG